MKYFAKLKRLHIHHEDSGFAIKAEILLDMTDPLSDWPKGDGSSTEMIGPSAIRVETVLESLPAKTEDQWVEWCLVFLKDRLPETAIKQSSVVS
ncbi:MAG: hypothetical protein ABF680_13665 [Acetobacter persici]